MATISAINGCAGLVEPVLEPHGVFAGVFFQGVGKGGVHHAAVYFGEECRAEHVGHVGPEHGKVPVVSCGRHADELFEAHIPVVHLGVVFTEPFQEFLIGKGPNNLILEGDGLAVFKVVGIVVPSYQHHLRIVTAQGRHVGTAVDRYQRVNIVGCQILCVLDGCGVLFAVKGVAIHEGDGAALGVDDFAVGNVRVAGGHFVLFEEFAQEVIVMGEQVVVFQERDDDLAESLVRNLYGVGERLFAVVCGVELELGFVDAAGVFVAIKRGDARFHFADEQVVLIVTPAWFYHYLLSAESHVLGHYIFAVEGGLAENADNTRLVAIHIGVAGFEAFRAAGNQGRYRKRNSKNDFLLHNAGKYNFLF